MLWLMLALQPTFGFLAFVSQPGQETFQIVGGLLLVSVTIFVWWRGAAMLTTLGINGPWRRGVFLAIVLPAAVYGSIFAAIFVPAELLQRARPPIDSPSSISIIISLIGYVVVFHALCRWVVAGAESKPVVQEEDEQT